MKKYQTPKAIYIIQIKGELSESMLNNFPEFTRMMAVNGLTVICTLISDQAELFGFLRRCRDIGAEILSVEQSGKTLWH